MSVQFSAEALEDLKHIGESIESYSKARAARFTSEIVSACHALSDMPLRYPLVPNFEGYGVRRQPLGNYLIFYEVSDGDVSIIHILHGARDYERLLFPDQ